MSEPRSKQGQPVHAGGRRKWDRLGAGQVGQLDGHGHRPVLWSERAGGDQTDG